MLEQQFRDECTKLGVINVNKLDNDWAAYQSVYLEMSQNGEKEVKATEYYNRLGGQYHVAKAALNLLKRNSMPHHGVEHPKPIWFQQVVTNITSNAEALWHQIDEQMSIEIARRVECAEAAMRKAEHEHLELGKYLDEVCGEKKHLEESINSLIGYRDENEQLSRSLESKCLRISALEDKLSETNVILEKYEKQREQLNQLQVEHAEINTELIMRNEQIDELKNEVQWLRETLNTTSKTSLPTRNPLAKTAGDLFIESIQNGEE
ncbi:hypothetical protein LRP52_24820 [Photobacterium sp. ZSDE20]|uniref:KfrA N-terminal DNA-binding domain-containing protein n=1 Tax=Photobacterium pectinilyticum TaxID=2906793 RepID=A0ABT1N484_9GAMM|nr:hypothetical protein [Photobacterium sp. ZSDE20]MCQ1059556.1 hypothetical protein [Photobacterium sp. ZSDE20]MDD1825419.1 hypothetical protein [Photobacterium sp. ZSDE20]